MPKRLISTLLQMIPLPLPRYHDLAITSPRDCSLKPLHLNSITVELDKFLD
jgi:hypothetical protein